MFVQEIYSNQIYSARRCETALFNILNPYLRCTEIIIYFEAMAARVFKGVGLCQ